MKHLFNILTVVTMASMMLLTACSSEEQLYDGPDYVMFADTMNICPVFEEGKAYQVALSATKAAPYDRTFGVEVLQSESNAIDGYHYTLSTNTVTIPAGKLAASIEVTGIYENIEEKDSLNIRMRLVAKDELKWDYYGDIANVYLQKVCPFNIDNFTRYAVVQSSFLNELKPKETKRLIMTERVEGEENSIMLRDLFTDGYDVKMMLDNSDPLHPKAEVREGDIVGTTQEYLGGIYNDNMIRIADYASVPSTFNTCRNTATLVSLFFVNKVGYVGAYATVIRWISDAEAQDILENGF